MPQAIVAARACIVCGQLRGCRVQRQLTAGTSLLKLPASQHANPLILLDPRCCAEHRDAITSQARLVTDLEASPKQYLHSMVMCVCYSIIVYCVMWTTAATSLS